MEIPIFIDRPELVGGNKFLEAFEWWNCLVVAFLGGRTAGGSVFFAEPVIRRSPYIRPNHVNAAPETVPRSNGIHHGILPVQFFQDAMIVRQQIIGRQTIAAVRPNNSGGMRSELANASAHTGSRHPPVVRPSRPPPPPPRPPH